MESRVTLLGHPVHQMLIVFPLGLLATSVVFDIAALASRESDLSTVAYWMLAAGLVGGVLAAPFGLLDWLQIPAGTRAKRIGAMHGSGNVVVLGCFLAGWLMRDAPAANPGALPISLSLAGVAIALVTAWLGGELVVRHGVGVHRDASLDAPGSLDSSARQHSHSRPARS